MVFVLCLLCEFFLWWVALVLERVCVWVSVKDTCQGVCSHFLGCVDALGLQVLASKRAQVCLSGELLGPRHAFRVFQLAHVFCVQVSVRNLCQGL